MTRFLVLYAMFVVIGAGGALAQPGGGVVSNDVFYQFMPIAWRDSNNDAQRFGDFNGMTASLDYLQELGITAVWMNPIFPSPAYHGYQHGRADWVNPRFGTEAEFLNFVTQAHARGIKVFVDFVVYGISHDSPWFQSAYGNPASPYDAWLAFTNTANTTYDGSVYTTWNGATVGFIEWDLRNAYPANLVATWAQHWLDPDGDGDPADGIDGFRLDHVLVQNDHGPDGWGYNLDDFWAPWKAALQTVNPVVFIFAEQADWGITGATLLPVFDAAFTKPFEFAARSALSSETAAALYSSMASTLGELPAGRTFLGTIGDHDVDRLTSVIGGSLTKAKAAAAILMTQPFPPIIYYGDELGMLGVKASYGSDANDIPLREPFKWNAVAGPPMSNYWVLNNPAYTHAYSQNNDGRSVQEQDHVAGSLLEAYKALIAARKAHPALNRGTYQAVTNSSSRVWSFLRHAAGEETLLVAINVYGSSRSVTLDLGSATIPGGATTVVDVLTGQTLASLTDANKAAYPLTVAAYGYRILAVSLIPGIPPANTINGANVPGDFGGAALVATQNNVTGLGNNVSELDQLFVRLAPDGLRIGVTGNLATDTTGLCVLLDTVTGGQNVVRIEGYDPPPALPGLLNGLRFDAGFWPDVLLFLNASGSTFWCDQFSLPASGGTTKVYRGSGTVSDGDGFLSGGSNPNGMQIAFNNSNVLGITDTSVAGAATATTGFEMLIPYADVGLSGMPAAVGIAVFIAQSNGDVSNQWLPGLGGGYPNLGATPDLTAIAGQQYAVVAAPVVCRGDCNCDGGVDFADIDYFVAAIPDNVAAWQGLYAARNGGAVPPCGFENCDLTADGHVDFADIDPFVGRIPSACP